MCKVVLAVRQYGSHTECADQDTTHPEVVGIVGLRYGNRLYLQYGIAYVKEIVPEKHIMRYPQFFAINALLERLKTNARGGIIWHTQGSGKTALSAFSNPVIKDYFSKRKVNTRFFFIVDRLDLMRQATQEFKNRYFNVINCSNKSELSKELNTSLPMTSDDCIGDVVVVNTHKIVDNSKMPQAKNDYGAKIQRIFFVDEAHRSYSQHGEFYKNLMTCDLDGVYIAMTGTPILTKKERSNLKFGDYIHKYFYDKSIADGYTLRIKKEKIKDLLKTSTPIAFQGLIEVTAFSLSAIMVGWFGKVALAAHQIAMSMSSFSFMVAQGIGAAATIRVSHQLGEKDFASTRKAGFAAMHMATAFMGFAGIVDNLFA